MPSILSEVLYYLEPAAVRACARPRRRDHAASVPTWWRCTTARHVAEHALRGDEVHALIGEHPAWARDRSALRGPVRARRLRPPMSDLGGIAIGIPAHDEAERIDRALASVLAAARR